MKKTIDRYTFIRSFLDSEYYKDNFSIKGLDSLFDYLEQLEKDIDVEIEFDIIAICCDFEEYSSFEDLQCSYDYIKSVEELKEYTTIIPIDNSKGFIIENF